MTGAVTFYTSFEVQPVTTTMLKESVGGKNFTSMFIMLNFGGYPSPSRPLTGGEREFAQT